jgi:two-component system, LytTR family, sensor histidine kinase AlgZ
MHPILAKRSLLGLYLAVWIPVGGGLAVLLALSGERPWAEAAAVAVPLTVAYAFVCLSSWYLCRTLPLQGPTAARVLATLAAAATVSTSLWLLAGRGWSAFLSASAFPGADQAFLRQAPLLFAVGTLLFLLAAALHYVLIAIEESRLSETRALELKVMSSEAELRALRDQIQPHFLFNSLNSISALTTTDPEGARRMTLLLAGFLRSSLTLGPRDLITLGEELALADSYLAMERVRFGKRLAVDLHVDHDTREWLVLPLILQPLVENAVTHGIASLLEGGVVRIEARRRGERVEIGIENPCDPDRPRHPGTGVGLDNVRRRLDAFYGREARLDVEETPASFRVDVSLPGAGVRAATVEGSAL